VAVRLAGRDLALYRDGRGVVRAVDDLCPHRRLPMSLGRVTSDGQIQCGYHGWIFDGASGRCTAIPNLTADERPAGRIRLPVFSTDSWQDLVLVWNGDELAPRLPSPVLTGPAASIKGHVAVRAPVGLVLDALTVNPGAALGLGPVFGSGEEETEPIARLDGNVLRVDRVRQTFALPRIGTFDPFVDHVTAATIAVHIGTGLVEVATQPAAAGVGARLVVGVAPITTHRTAVRWSLGLSGRGASLLGRAAVALTAVRRITGDGASLCERVADDIEGRRDHATDILRGLRETSSSARAAGLMIEELT
jgi:nitrite reductase/ring-hydroxylating ferredoxin subunit